MGFLDAFEPYSPEKKGKLEDYLRTHDGRSTDNHFRGPEYFFIIRDKELMVPGTTCVRVSHSPSPDILYFVNEDYHLESHRQGRQNMSAAFAEKGVYKAEEVLKQKDWSIHGLRI